MRAFLAVAIALAWLALPASPALAGKVALVIGNDAYTQVTPLARAVADARAYRDQLSGLRGFDVIYAENADRNTMIAKIGEFLGKVRRDDVAMVVYSGHGVQLDPNRGDSLYLLPTDIPSVDPGSGGASFFMDARAINFARLSTEVEARGARLRLFVLDACRNNPFPPAPGGRSVGMSRGLGTIRSSRGEFIFFAAAPGEVALDYLPGEDASSNSVFTRVFLKHFTQGAYLEDVANEVQAEVLDLSRQASISQEPYYTDGVAGKTCIDQECGVVAPPPTPPASATGDDLERTYWRLCETRNTPAFCEAYIDEYPEGPHAPLARLIVAELAAAEAGAGAETMPAETIPADLAPAETTPADTAPAAPAPEPAAGPAPQPLAGPTTEAEHQPVADTAPERQPQPVAEAPQPQPVADTAPQPGPLPTPEAASEPEPPQEVAAISPAHVRGENPREDMRTEMQRDADDSWATLGEESWDIRALRRFHDQYPEAQQAAAAAQRIAYLRDRHAEAQRELNRLGYKAGPVDGDWGRRSTRALQGFQGDNGMSRTGVVDARVLAKLKAATPRVATRTPAPQPTQQPSEQPASPPVEQSEARTGGFRQPGTTPPLTPQRQASRETDGFRQPGTRPPLTPQPQVQAPEPRVAALPPATGGIGDGETWVAKAVTNRGTKLKAKLTRKGNRLRLEVKFDHRGNASYYPYLNSRYTKSCSEPATTTKFDCWFTGDIEVNRPSSPGARVRGVFPRLRLQAHNLIGSADLVFKPPR